MSGSGAEEEQYRDIRLFNFWFWTENGFKVQTVECGAKEAAELNLAGLKQLLSPDIYHPPPGFQVPESNLQATNL